MTPEQPVPQAKVSLRSRILWPMVILAGVTLLVSGLIMAVIEHRNVDASVDSELLRVRQQLQILATEGVDPDTGAAFASAEDLLRAYLSRTVISDEEGEFAFVAGRVAFVPKTDAFRPENDKQLVDAVRGFAAGEQSVVETVTTDQARYRVLVAPVIFPSGSGALVHVFDMEAVERELRGTMTVYAVAAAVTLALAGVVAWFMVGRQLRPIEELRAAAESIDEADLTSRVPVRGKDDLARLSATLNRMLDRVQGAVESQRQLLDDVGHELRTPITVVRGHLEVVDTHDPDDVAQTRALALDELDRMGVLINDLLMLAKAGQSDFVTPEWADLAVLTDLTLEKARALGDRRWRLESVADAEAWVDPNRITQAWLQLAANAVKYSEPGTPITLGSRLHRGQIHLWVADEGIGIAEDQLAVVRERFGRGRAAASHAQGAGLGLSIVESIVAAHGGRLDIESTEGEGSTFTIVLPLTPSEPTDEGDPP